MTNAWRESLSALAAAAVLLVAAAVWAQGGGAVPVQWLRKPSPTLRAVVEESGAFLFPAELIPGCFDPPRDLPIVPTSRGEANAFCDPDPQRLYNMVCRAFGYNAGATETVRGEHIQVVPPEDRQADCGAEQLRMDEGLWAILGDHHLE